MHRLTVFCMSLYCLSSAILAARVAHAEQAGLREIQSAVLARPYRVQLSVAVEGTAPFTYALGGDVKPSCLTVDPLSGVLHGTPTRACLGNHRIHIVVTDYDGAQTAQDFLLHITDGSVVSSQPVQVARLAAPPRLDRKTGLILRGSAGPEARSQTLTSRPASGLNDPPSDEETAQITPLAPPNGSSSGKARDDPSEGAARLSQAVASMHHAAHVKPHKLSGGGHPLAVAAMGVGGARPSDCIDWNKDKWVSQTVMTACEKNAQDALQQASTTYKSLQSPTTKDRQGTLRDSLLLLRDASADAADNLESVKTPEMPSAIKADFDARISYWRQLNGFLIADQSDIDAGNDIGDPSASFHPMPWFIEHAESFGIAGTSLSAATGISTTAKLFAELYGDVPVILKDYYGLRAWGYARIGSIAQTSATLSSTAVNQSITQALGTSSQSFVQSGEFSGGISIRLPIPQKADGPSLAFTVGAGAITPLSAPSTQGTLPYYVTPDIYTYYTQTYYSPLYSPQLKALCGGVSTTAPTTTTSTCFAAFYPQDRSRFFRQYAAGLRLKIPLKAVIPGSSHFPATFDATVGQNEYVTGGKLNGAVVHIGGAAPLIYATGLYAFGGLDLGVHGPGDQSSPLLLPTPVGDNATTTNTVNIQLPQPNRDRYTLGLGFDLLKLISDRAKMQAK